MICNTKIKGRIDKKYCSANCKSIHQYETRRNEETLFFKVDKQLKTNRKILKKYNKVGKTALRKNVLHEEGFDPNYFTHFRRYDENSIYFYCYDFGFMTIKDNDKHKYLIVNWNGK
jgi:hypothetical protein